MTDKKPTQWGGIVVALLIAYIGSQQPVGAFGGLNFSFHFGGAILAYFLFRWLTKKVTFIKNGNLRGFICGLFIFVLFWILSPLLAGFVWLLIKGAF